MIYDGEAGNKTNRIDGAPRERCKKEEEKE